MKLAGSGLFDDELFLSPYDRVGTRFKGAREPRMS